MECRYIDLYVTKRLQSYTQEYGERVELFQTFQPRRCFLQKKRNSMFSSYQENRHVFNKI